ncbi:unnamed protein product [Rotaria magnacalcarata]|uniref:MULE transposase domain-containing protein n=1 Tax=Rotaria magnacalcarata TaxID=392030 RepID=A0A8S2Q4T1_9BILA|nr:unnamed protein product [Rotaria magnacalcarata]
MKNNIVTYLSLQRWNGKRHVHPPDPVDQRRRQIISTIKKRVANEHIPVCSIVEQEYATAKLTKEEQEIFKTPKQLESGLLKSRRKMYPPLPTCQNFVIPDFISKTIDSTPFLLFDQTRNEFGGRLLVFSSQSQMDLLLDAEVLMADGTFRSCPRLFEQIYVILAVKDSKTYPVLFALTSNRKEATYITILDVIRTEAQHRGVSFAPHVFISDYEQAWMNAVKRKLITTPISGCWFHHVQAIYRWIQSNGLSKTYQEHEEKRQILGSFMALSLLPKDRVLEGLHIVKSRAVKHNELRQFVLYFEPNNHRLNARIRQWHPNIWYFLVHLRTEEATISRNILKANLALIAPSQYQPTSKKHAAKKTMQIIHLHQLLEKKSRPLEDVITSLSYLIYNSSNYILTNHPNTISGMEPTAVIQSNIIPPTHRIVLDDIVKDKGQILQLLDRRKEISVATDLFFNSLFYSTNLASAASIEHILKSKQLEVSTRRIQAIHTCIAQYVHSEPIYEKIDSTDDESDIKEFDPMLFSSISNSINNSDNEDHTQTLETRMSASKQAGSKETNIVTQTDLTQLTYDVIDEESSTTRNEDEHEKTGGHEEVSEVEELGGHEEARESEIEGKSQEQDQGEGVSGEQTSITKLANTDISSIISCKYKSTDNCKRIKLAQELVEVSCSTNCVDFYDEDDINLNFMFNNEQMICDESECNGLEATAIIKTSSAVSTSFSNSNNILTTESIREQVEINTELPSINPTTASVVSIEEPISVLKDIPDKTEAIPVESQRTKLNEYLEFPDECLMINTDSTNIAAVVEVVTANVPKQQPANKLKRRIKHVFTPTEERYYFTRSGR